MSSKNRSEKYNSYISGEKRISVYISGLDGGATNGCTRDALQCSVSASTYGEWHREFDPRVYRG